MIRLLLILLILPVGATANESPYRGLWEAGYLLGFGFYEDGVTRNMPYLHLQGRYDPTIPEGCNILYSYEAAVRLEFDGAVNEGRINPRAAFVQRLSDKTSLRLGLQEIAWGETFGFFIADIVNPRDLRDPLYNEISWQRRPVFALNFQWLPDPWNFQLIVVPVPRNNLLAGEGDPFFTFPPAVVALPLQPLRDFEIGALGNEAEYGARVGFLFKSGLDISTYYYRHWNRNPIYAILPVMGVNSLVPIQERVHTVGFSFTKAKEEIVYRGDLLVHVDQPWSPNRFGQVLRRDVFQAILGMDKTVLKGWSWGVQVHCDAWKEATLWWVSAQASRSLCKDKHQFEIFGFKGLNCDDLWIQPKYTIRSGEHWSYSLRCDIVVASDETGSACDGVLGPVSEKDRVLAVVTRSF